ncbi:DEAD/DEAH box helicase [Blautia producta]|uniref:DEAD/DEAH box helicase n=1 Tax=Blautia producta TaxID=33035 RepID=UPI0031B565BC
MKHYFINHYKNLRYTKDCKRSSGLRNAQIGAIHAISSYFTLNKSKTAVVVMPTGSGKTAVLMMTPYVLLKEKVLVVTPSKMVRGQIFEDFSLLNTLCKANVFQKSMAKPKVCEMEHKYAEDNLKEIMDADVIIATPMCALSLSKERAISESIDLVLIDEAHHSPAATWEQILVNLKHATHILFTATPFRLDKKEIKGDIIYNYPLSLAYSDGIFGEIQYIPIECKNGDNIDIKIAEMAEQVFLSDREKGLNHYLMVRTNSKSDALKLEKLYRENTELKLRRIDSSMSNLIVKKCIEELKSEKLDGIICVDMLGEGFDFPSLKIAAIHSPHKSLASTLQFIGRFARTNAPNIGTAKFIALNDEELEIENNRLYASDAIWQDMIIYMSESKSKEEEENKKYFEDYKKSTSQMDNGEEISLRGIRPNCHARVYMVPKFNLHGEFPEICKVSDRTYINEKDNTVIGIGIDLSTPKWLIGSDKINKEYILYIVHYQKDTGLLFIYSQCKSEVQYEIIAKAFSESCDKIPKHKMNRVLGKLKDFEIFNSGMLNRYNESGESYRISAGSDVSNAIDPSTGKLYSPGHVFCKANTDDKSITIGYSSGSKMWSSAYLTIPEYVSWCDTNGYKIIDKNIEVKTNTNFDLLPMPKELRNYPDKIFLADYNPDTYMLPPALMINGKKELHSTLIDYKLKIRKIVSDKITLSVEIEDTEEIIDCDVQGRYKSLANKITIKKGKENLRLDEYLCEHPLIYRTTDDAMIMGGEIYQGNPGAISFDVKNIEAVDWDKYRTNVKVEVKNPAGTSIQDTLEKILTSDRKYKYIIYDHTKGEIADFITGTETENDFIIELYHVKKMSATKYNNRVDDIYEVAGQAVKSIVWLKTKSILLSKMEERRKSGHCEFIRGHYDQFRKDLTGAGKQFIGNVVIVQPSLSKGMAMPHKIQEILAASSYYIEKSGRVKKLRIMGSK